MVWYNIAKILAGIYAISMICSALFVSFQYDAIEKSVRRYDPFFRRHVFALLFAVSLFIFLPLVNTVTCLAFLLWLYSKATE